MVLPCQFSTPGVPASGYEKNRIRKESVSQAQEIDQRIARAWRRHPRVVTVSAQAGFLDKLAYAIELRTREVRRGYMDQLNQTEMSRWQETRGRTRR